MSYNSKQIQILATAENLFSSKGYDGTSVRDIADDAGVNIAMISYYFGSKEKLMEALFEQRTQHIKLKVETLLQEDIPSFAKMEMLIKEYLDRTIEKQNFFKIMICEQVINKNPVIVNLIRDLKNRNIEEVSKLITEGQEKGDFKKDVDVLLVMNTLIGTVTQMMLTLNYYREYNELKNISDEEFYEHIKRKLSDHLKVLFKALLSYEA